MLIYDGWLLNKIKVKQMTIYTQEDMFDVAEKLV